MSNIGDRVILEISEAIDWTKFLKAETTVVLAGKAKYSFLTDATVAVLTGVVCIQAIVKTDRIIQVAKHDCFKAVEIYWDGTVYILVFHPSDGSGTHVSVVRGKRHTAWMVE